MSERAISDPAVAGWELNPDTGYWMWTAATGGNIQDGDTEGQITTWDGTEWTPEGAVVVADGAVNITSSTDTTKLNIINSLGVYEVVNNEYGSLAVNYNGAEQLVLASNGDVYVTGKLFINGEEVSAGGGGGLWTDNGDGSISYSGTAKASDFVTT